MPADLYAKFPAKVRELYAVVSAIPRGKVANYALVGQLCGMGARQVGYWLHKNPDGSHVPCHRVVQASGSLAGGYAFGGPGIQKQRLEEEGVQFGGEKVSRSSFTTATELSQFLF